MKYILPRNKGLITGAVMIAVSILIYFAKGNFDGTLQYVVYSIYLAGIVWTLIDFKKNATTLPTFKEFFSQGFKCFIVVTLLMVVFTLIFILLHPELKEQMAANMQAEMSKSKDLVQSDIDARIVTAKKIFLPAFLMGAVFGYLIIGALVTVIGAGFLSQKKNIA
jgi:uncharacterized membrane protein (DUF485 family)